MSRVITVVVRSQTGAVSSVPLKSGGIVTAESYNNYRLLVDGKEKLPDGTKIYRSERDLKIRFADGEEVTVSDWAGADGARFETGGAEVYSESLRSFVPAQQVESWQFELLGTGDLVAGQLGAAPEALLASVAPAAASVSASSAVIAPVGTAAGTAGGTAATTTSAGSVSTGVAAKAASGFSGSGVLLGLGALGGLAAAAGGGGGSGGSSGSGSTPSTPASTAPSTPTGLALAAASDSGTVGDNITNDTTPTISGRGDAGTTIELRNASGTTIATATVDSAGNWSATPTAALADGPVTLQVISNRGTGTTASAAASITLTIDSTAPGAPVARLDASSDSGLAGDSRTNDSTPTISGTGTAGDTIRVTLPGGAVLTAVVAANGTWSVTPTTALADGIASLSVTATDAAGNASAAATLSFTIDTVGPAAPTLAAPEGPVINAAENADGIQVNVTGAYAAGDTVAVVVTRPDSSTTTVSRLVTAAEISAGLVALTVPAQSLQGSYTLRASITDTAGNVGAASAPLALTLASTGPQAPTLALAEAADTYINAAEATSLGGTPVTVTLPSGTVSGASIALVLRAPGGAAITINQAVTAADVSAGFATIVIPTASIAADGVYSVVGTVTDANGNVGPTSDPSSFTVDRTIVATGAPDLAAASDTGSSSTDNLTRNTTPTFTGTGAEAGAVVTLYDTNGTTILGTGVADAAGAWSIVSATLAGGVHTVSARQTDLAGNVSVASAGLAVTIDATAPTFGKSLAVNEGFSTLTIDSGAGSLAGADDLTTQASLAVSDAVFKSSASFLATDFDIVIANGKATLTPVAGASNKYGTVVLSVSMRDAAGNVTTQDVTVTVNSVNDAPSGVDGTVTASEDGTYVFSTSDFAFTDASDSPANGLKSILISSLPAVGSLQYNGKAVTGGLEITAADIAAGKLTFTPVANAVGTGYTSFTFQVRDDGGTTSGGVDLDATANKLTIDVVNVNDAPVLDVSKSPVISTVEYAFSGGTDAAVHAPVGANPTGVFTAASLLTGAVSDIDPGAKLGGVGVTGLSNGSLGATLWYSTDSGTTWDWITNTAGSKITTGFYGADGVAGGSDNNVLLLSDTARMVFDGGTSARASTIADALTIRAWDQSSGTNGGALTNPATGGTSPLSALADNVQATLTTQSIDLTRLSPTSGVRITGATAGAQFGWDVSSAGDANGDGFDDMLISQRGTAGSGGSAFLVYGQSGAYGSVGADGTRSVGIGSVTGARFNRPGELMTGVTQLGDFNNDGYADFMISGVAVSSVDTGETGSAYVVFGGASISNISELGVTSSSGKWFQIEAGGTSGIGYNNHAASWTGDVNGDGYDDLIIGAKYTPQLGTAPYNFGGGAAYVIYGHAGTKFGTNNDLNLSALRTDVTALADDGNPAGYLFDAGTNTRGIVYGVGASSGYFFGRGVAGVGDRNGDGYADYAINVDLGAGAVNALVLHGKLTTDATNGGGGNVMWFAAADGYTGPDWIGHGDFANGGVNPYRIRVTGNGDYTGELTEPNRIATQALGDVNGDGFDDWAMTYNGIGAGKVYVIYGSTTVLDDRSSGAMAGGAGGFLISGVALGDKLGESIHGIGDVNGDGYDDFIVGAPRNEFGTATDQGGAYIVYGRPDGGADDIDLANGIGNRGIAIRGNFTGDQAGFAVNSAGDVNGDGLDDFLIGAPQSDAGGVDAGAMYLLYGSTAYGNAGASIGSSLTGTAGANSLIGTSGADTLNGGAGGADAIFGGAGNDTIVVGSNGWLRVDGGAGLDTLQVGAAMTLDFTAIGTAAGQNLSGHTRSIERIDLRAGSFASKMTLAEQDVYQLAGDFTASGGSLSGRVSNALFVVGDASDTFTFSEGVGGATGWTVAGTGINALGDGNTYTQFTRGTAAVYVASGVTVTGVTTGTAGANLITGTSANELIAGLAGADIITGGAGNDTLYGGAIGSTAATSEAGVKDIFAYSLTPNTAHGNDVIKDFQVGTDRLYLVDTADSSTANSVPVTATPPDGSTLAYAADGTTYQGYDATVVPTATTNDDIDNNLSIRDLTLADSPNQYLSFGTDGLGNVKLTIVSGTATSSIVLEGVQYEAVSSAANGKYSSIADLMGANGETRVLYLTNDPFGNGLSTLP